MYWVTVGVMVIVSRESKMEILGWTAPMLRRWLWLLARSMAAGWAALIALTYVAERPLLLLTPPIVGAHWVATATLALGCLKLAASGWAIGRLHRMAPLPGVLAFAATLGLFNFEAWQPINVPGLIRLAMDAVHDIRYWEPLTTMAAQHVLLFGSLVAGGLLSRLPQPPLSLFGKTPQ